MMPGFMKNKNNELNRKSKLTDKKRDNLFWFNLFLLLNVKNRSNLILEPNRR